MKKLLIIFIGWLVPTAVGAQVVINEVAWMGNEVSSNDEWLELRNTSSNSVDLSGWSLNASDGSPEIELAGSIPGNGYFLLERTDDTSAPGVTADLIYSGALSNSGEDLVLSSLSGEVDRASFSSGWPAGDNFTKETMQRTDSGSWITGSPTPGAINTGTSNTSSNNSNNSSNIPTSSSYSGSGDLKTAEPLEDLFVYAGRDRNVMAGVPTVFEARASESKNSKTLEDVKYYWSFGDGSKGKGQKIRHVYEFPGAYVIFLTAKAGGKEALTRVNVSVIDFPLEIINTEDGLDGFVEVKNNSDTESNLGGLVLETQNNKFMIPENTIIVPRGSIKIPNYSSGLVDAEDGVEIVSLKIKERPRELVLGASTPKNNQIENIKNQITALSDQLQQIYLANMQETIRPQNTKNAVVGNVEGVENEVEVTRVVLPKEPGIVTKALSLPKKLLKLF